MNTPFTPPERGFGFGFGPQDRRALHEHRRQARREFRDHVREHRPDGTGGTTGDWNLIALCERHHRIKHQTPWTPILLDDGTVTWRNDLLRLTLHDEITHL